MPVIVYKTMTLRVAWAQVRRIRCTHCKVDFCYVVGGTRTSQSMGLPLLSDDEDMRDSVQKRIQGQLDGLARSRRLGEAKCPGCRRHQPWMAWETAKSLAGHALLGLIVAAMLGLFATVLTTGGSDFLARYVVLTLLFWAGYVAIAWWWKSGRFSHRPEGDPRAMTTAAFSEFLAECESSNEDPALAWRWRRVLGKMPKQDLAVVSLGVADRTGTPASG